jgi:elongation factor G
MADDIHRRSWLIEIAIEPKSKADREKLDVALAKLTAEDPSFRITTDRESGQIMLQGLGELHLDSKVDLLRRTYKVDVNIGAPQVAYREKIARQATRRLYVAVAVAALVVVQ